MRGIDVEFHGVVYVDWEVAEAGRVGRVRCEEIHIIGWFLARREQPGEVSGGHDSDNSEGASVIIVLDAVTSNLE
jgi:hypothetical protein